MTKDRRFFLILFLLLFMIELCIALFIRDRFIRPYVGDVLVVPLLYCLLRAFIRDYKKWLPAAVFLFAVFVECLQYVDILSFLGLERYSVLRIIAGGTFDMADIFCYFIGMILIYLCRQAGRYLNLF